MPMLTEPQPGFLDTLRRVRQEAETRTPGEVVKRHKCLSLAIEDTVAFQRYFEQLNNIEQRVLLRDMAAHALVADGLLPRMDEIAGLCAPLCR